MARNDFTEIEEQLVERYPSGLGQSIQDVDNFRGISMGLDGGEAEAASYWGYKQRFSGIPVQ